MQHIGDVALRFRIAQRPPSGIHGSQPDGEAQQVEHGEEVLRGHRVRKGERNIARKVMRTLPKVSDLYAEPISKAGTHACPFPSPATAPPER